MQLERLISILDRWGLKTFITLKDQTVTFGYVAMVNCTPHDRKGTSLLPHEIQGRYTALRRKLPLCT